jgi:hypothetical protein
MGAGGPWRWQLGGVGYAVRWRGYTVLLHGSCCLGCNQLTWMDQDIWETPCIWVGPRAGWGPICGPAADRTCDLQEIWSTVWITPTGDTLHVFDDTAHHVVGTAGGCCRPCMKPVEAG